jgi:C_GCAxxG_C_C family probable redox protein
MATPFGGGVARWGTVCGAVTGGALMLGSFFGITKGEEKEQRDKNYVKVQAMIREFEKNFGTIQCRDLIHLNLLDPEDRKKFEERNVRKQCARMVAKNLENIRRLIDEK